MAGQRAWRVGTGFRELLLRLNPSAPPLPAAARGSMDAALRELLFAVEGRRPDAVSAVRELLEALSGIPASPSNHHQPGFLQPLDGLERELRAALRFGILTIEKPRPRVGVPVVEEEEPPPPPVRRTKPVAAPVSYDVTVIDDRGGPVSGIDINLTVDGVPETITTTARGTAHSEGQNGTTAQLKMLDVSGLPAKLEAIWRRPRAQTLPKGPDVNQVIAGLPFEALAVRPNAPFTLILARPELATFTLVVLDELGVPVPGVDVTLELPSGPRTLPTDATGQVLVDRVAGPVSATLADVAQVREVLRPRFLAPRVPVAIDDTDPVVRALSDLIAPIELKPDQPITLLLTPTVECHEIPGANFDFGRSFVRSSAIAQLSQIAEALRNTTDVQALIFGHTDLSGSEALNKELSERRAHAVHALLTHDSVAWEQLFSGTGDGANWQEKWDIEEVQDMLNALACGDDSGAPLIENNLRDAATKQAIHRFQRGDFPDRPAEQAPIPETDVLGVNGRRLLFLAYAKRISRQPIAPDRFLAINGAAFMGCSEFNALSLSARDTNSRRVNVFLFDPVAAPAPLPCKLRQLAPCRANLDPKPTTLGADGKAPFRCRVFQDLARKCRSQPSPDLSHDLILRFPLQLVKADQLAHTYTLEADDGTLSMSRALADDARANDDALAELTFEHLPENHRYRLMCDDGELPPYIVFDFATIKELQDKFRTEQIAVDLTLPADFAQFASEDVEPVGDEDGSHLRDDGTNPEDDEVDEDEDEEPSGEPPAGGISGQTRGISG